jgi:hypothetical protein
LLKQIIASIYIFKKQEKSIMNKIRNMTHRMMETLFGILVLYISASGIAQAACTPSSNGLTIPAATSLCDNANNSWTVVAGVIQMNGAAQTGTQNVIELLWQDGTVYQENASHLWWRWSNNAWVSTSQPESLSGATIPAAPQLNDSNGNYWTVSGGVIQMNGVSHVGTQNVVLLLYYNRVIYQKNAAGGWWKWESNNWVTTSDPRVCVASPDNTSIPSAASICDNNSALWTVVSGVIKMNGVDSPYTQNVILLLWQGGTLYQENASHLWWKWSNNTWVSTPAPESPSGTSIPSALQLNDSAGNYWTVSGGVIQLNGVSQVGTQNVVLMLYYNHVVYQQNAAGGWWKWNGSAWISTTDPRVCTASPDNTSIPNASSICDNNGGVWTVVSGAVKLNGQDAQYTNQVTLLLWYQGGIYQQNAAGGWWKWNGTDWVASSDPRTTGTSCTPSSIAPAIGTKAAWDSHFVTPYGNSLPDLSTDGGDMAWTLYYWVRAYVSMAMTYGDTKYLDRAVGSIDHMLAYENSGGGWGKAPLYNQLGTAQVSQAIMQFVYAVHKDPRFTAYRSKADTYLARAERAVHVFDYQWVDDSPLLGLHASFYRYATCGANGASLCGTDSLLMYNQGASMSKALLLMDRVYRLKGQTPPAGYLDKANKAANYFLKFAQNVNGGYLWRYEGARPGNGYEDTNHGHVDVSFLYAAGKFHIGGLTDTDMAKIAATFKNRILNGQPGPNDVSVVIDGTGVPSSNYDRVTAGYDWIDYADYDPVLLSKVVNVFNRTMTTFNVARGAHGWAEILRKNSCTSLY